MPITRAKKEELVQALTEELQKSQTIILTDPRGLAVSEMTKLRRKLRQASARYRVVKNTLARLAFERAGRSLLAEWLEGPTAISFCYGDASEPAKVLTEFVKEAETFKLKGGLLGERVLNVADISALATLPSRDVLRADLVGNLQSPLAGLVNLLAAPLHDFVYVLEARAQQLQAQSTTQPAN